MVVQRKLHEASGGSQKAEADRDAAGAEALRHEIEQIIATLRGLGADGLAELKAALGDRLPAIDPAETWQGVESRLAGELRSHPLRSLGIAALSGLALGLILRR